MNTKYPWLTKPDFLKRFDQIRDKEQYAKITVLNFQEEALMDIQGKVTGGTLNIAGNSAIRRTCNISLVADKEFNDLTKVNASMLSINKKVRLEIGFKNTTGEYTDYDILWFPVGVFVIINPSITHALDGVNISLQLKDKMCLLNGECGGLIPASTQFHRYDTVDENGHYVTLKPTIYQIIQELVNHFGGEQLPKIIISDVDTRIKQVMRWIGEVPLFIIAKTAGGTIQYISTLDEGSAVAAGGYKKYSFGDDIGYIYTDFTYPGELIANPGDSICTILDKIKATLGNYEYFYDLDGNFVFQEIKNYLNTTQATVELDKLKSSDYFVDLSRGKSVYVFDDSNLVATYSHSPQFSMIKNDFVVWGMRKDANGNSWPIRYHLAIEPKPAVGNTYNVFFYEDPDDGLIKAKCPMQFNSRGELPQTGVEEVFYQVAGEGIFKWDAKLKEYVQVDIQLTPITTKDWRDELFLQGSIAEPLGIKSNYYYTALKNEWPKLYDTQEGKFKDEVIAYPTDLDYFLDFIDSELPIREFSVENIGRRSKVVVDDKVNCVFEPEIPNLVLLDTGSEDIERLRQECEDRGQDYIQLDSNIFSMTATGGRFNSAYMLVRDMLYQYTSYNAAITVSALPIYYLEPNTRITVRDSASGIYGDYMINSISIPLDIRGMMNLSCVQALTKI